jgi:ABC-type proline/glycine betaine transport system permease subunit
MNTARWRRTIPTIALLVLLNVMVGLCACVGDTPVVSGGERSAVLTTNQTDRPHVNECGDGCDSCICCASLVLTPPIRVEAAVTAGSKAMVAAASAPEDPEPQTLKRPPRA